MPDRSAIDPSPAAHQQAVIAQASSNPGIYNISVTGSLGMVDSAGQLRAVAKVLPELVVRDDKGRIDLVRYHELAQMLLNEVQPQAAEIRDIKKQQQQMIAAQDSQINQLNEQLTDMRAAVLTLQSKDKLVAQR